MRGAKHNFRTRSSFPTVSWKQCAKTPFCSWCLSWSGSNASGPEPEGAASIREDANRSRSYPQGPVGRSDGRSVADKARFTETLASAVAAYPEARVELDEKGGRTSSLKAADRTVASAALWRVDQSYRLTPHPPGCFARNSRDCRDAAIDRTPPLAPDRDLDLDTTFLADVNLLHRQRIPLEQPADHVGGRHGLRLGAPVGDGLLRKCLDPRLDPAEFRCLPHGVGVPLSKADLGRSARHG